MSECEAKCCCDLHPHPDHLMAWTMIVDAGSRYVVLPHTLHILSVEAEVYISADTNGIYVKLFNTEDYTDSDLDEDVWTISLGSAVGSAGWLPDAMKGYPFPQGLYADVRSDDTTAQVVLNIVAVKREHYTPAFPAPNQWLKNAWDCWNTGDLYENFDRGGNYSQDSGSGGTAGPPGGGIGSGALD